MGPVGVGVGVEEELNMVLEMARDAEPVTVGMAEDAEAREALN